MKIICKATATNVKKEKRLIVKANPFNVIILKPRIVYYTK